MKEPDRLTRRSTNSWPMGWRRAVPSFSKIFANKCKKEWRYFSTSRWLISCNKRWIHLLTVKWKNKLNRANNPAKTLVWILGGRLMLIKDGRLWSLWLKWEEALMYFQLVLSRVSDQRKDLMERLHMYHKYHSSMLASTWHWKMWNRMRTSQPDHRRVWLIRKRMSLLIFSRKSNKTLMYNIDSH